MSPQLLQKFKELFHSMGLTEDMLVVLPHSGECQEGGGIHVPSVWGCSTGIQCEAMLTLLSSH